MWKDEVVDGYPSSGQYVVQNEFRSMTYVDDDILVDLYQALFQNLQTWQKAYDQERAMYTRERILMRVIDMH